LFEYVKHIVPVDIVFPAPLRNESVRMIAPIAPNMDVNEVDQLADGSCIKGERHDSSVGDDHRAAEEDSPSETALSAAPCASHCSAFVPGSTVFDASCGHRLLIEEISLRMSCPTRADISFRTRRTSL
jgi:hypothetical protein